MKIHDCLLGLIILVSALCIGYVGSTYPDQNDGKPGPWLFPVVLSGLFAVCGLILFLRGLKNFSSQGLIELQQGISSAGVIKMAVLVISVLLYMFISEYLGFMLTMGCIMFGLMLMLHTKPVMALVVTVLSVACMYFIFATMLGVPLPQGELIEKLMG